MDRAFPFRASLAVGSNSNLLSVLFTQFFRISLVFRVRYRPRTSQVASNLTLARGTLFVVNLFRLVKLPQSLLFTHFAEAEFALGPRGLNLSANAENAEISRYGLGRLGSEILRQRWTRQMMAPGRIIAVGKVTAVVN